MRAPLTGTGDRRSGRGCRALPNDERERRSVSARNATECGRVTGYLEKSPTSNEHPDSAYHMPGTELRSPAHRHRSAGAHLTHLLDHESPPGPRRPPESSPSGAGGSSCTSRERASRLLAGTSRSRAEVRRLAAGLLLVVAGLLGVSAAAQAQTTYVSNIGQTVQSGGTRAVGTSGSAQFTQAQPFTTGDNADGYTLSEVVVKVASGADNSDVPRVSIYSNSSGTPGTSLYTLTNPVPFGNGNRTFTAPPNATLAKETVYFVVFEETVDKWRLHSTSSDSEGTAESGWSIGDTHAWRNSDTGDWGSNTRSLLITIKAPAPPTPVTIEAEYESIGAGLEDLLFTLTREGETTDELDVTVTIVQDESWLGDSDLSHDVTFEADAATTELTIAASKFSFAPSTTGDLTATVTGDGIDGGSETVEIISTSGPPITISYEESAYTFAEEATDEAVYVVGDARCGLSPGVWAVESSQCRLFVADRYGGEPRRLRRDKLECDFIWQRFRACRRHRPARGPRGRSGLHYRERRYLRGLRELRDVY